MKVELEAHTKLVCLLNSAIFNQYHEQWKWSWMFTLNLLTALPPVLLLLLLQSQSLKYIASSDIIKLKSDVLLVRC